jgi:hypothetical protein
MDLVHAPWVFPRVFFCRAADTTVVGFVYWQAVLESRKDRTFGRPAGGALRHLALVATDEFALRHNVSIHGSADLFLRGPAHRLAHPLRGSSAAG